MKSDQPDNTDEILDELLSELSFEPASTVTVSHQAPAGLRQRIVLAQQAESSTPPTANSGYSHWLLSPWRAVAASMATLLLGVLLGSSTSAAQLYAAAVEPTSYPDNDQLLVIASLDDDFATTLGEELILDWGVEPSATYKEPSATYKEPSATYGEPSASYKEPAAQPEGENSQ